MRIASRRRQSLGQKHEQILGRTWRKERAEAVFEFLIRQFQVSHKSFSPLRVWSKSVNNWPVQIGMLSVRISTNMSRARLARDNRGSSMMSSSTKSRKMSGAAFVGK